MLLTLKDIYNDKVAKTVINTTSEDLDGIVVDPGCLLVTTCVSVANMTNNYDWLNFGIKLGSNFHAFADESTLLQYGVYWLSDKILVPAHYTLTCRLGACTAGDQISMYAQGYIYEIGE